MIIYKQMHEICNVRYKLDFLTNQLKNNLQMQLEEFKVNLDLRNNKKLYMPSNYSLFSTVALAVILSVSFTVHWLRRIMLDHISV